MVVGRDDGVPEVPRGAHVVAKSVDGRRPVTEVGERQVYAEVHGRALPGVGTRKDSRPLGPGAAKRTPRSGQTTTLVPPPPGIEGAPRHLLSGPVDAVLPGATYPPVGNGRQSRLRSGR